MKVAQVFDKDIDPSMVMPDGRDVRGVSRAERRRFGFRGPVYTAQAPSLSRFIRRHSDAVLAPAATRRQRKARARAVRAVQRRALG